MSLLTDCYDLGASGDADPNLSELHNVHRVMRAGTNLTCAFAFVRDFIAPYGSSIQPAASMCMGR
jgi:hypothetical protein